MKLGWIIGLLAVLQSPPAPNERTFRLRDGSVVIGAVVDASSQTLKLRSRSLGEMTVAREEVVSVDGRDDFALRLSEKDEEEQIDRDGTLRSRLALTDRNATARPLTTYRFLVDGSLASVSDPLGTPLDVSHEVCDGASRCTVSLRTPVPAGESFTLLLETIRPKAVEEREGRFVYQTTLVPEQSVLFRRALILPAGAIVESVKPEPDERDARRIVWRGSLAPGQAFQPSVVYRLP